MSCRYCDPKVRQARWSGRRQLRMIEQETGLDLSGEYMPMGWEDIPIVEAPDTTLFWAAMPRPILCVDEPEPVTPQEYAAAIIAAWDLGHLQTVRRDRTEECLRRLVLWCIARAAWSIEAMPIIQEAAERLRGENP